MNLPQSFFLLAGSVFDPEGISRGARHRQTFSAWDWTILAIVFALLVTSMTIWSWYTNRRERRRPYDSPLRLFWALCHAHGLRWTDCWMLWRLAHYQRLKEPARVFLEPERLSTANLSPALRLQEPRIGLLRYVLFADLPQQEQTIREEQAPLVEAPASSPGVSAAAPRAPTPNLDVPPWPDRCEPRGR